MSKLTVDQARRVRTGRAQNEGMLVVDSECYLVEEVCSCLADEIDRLTKENAALIMDRDDNAMACSMLGKENEQLKAERDRLQPVVDAAINWTNDHDGDCKLANAIATYRALNHKEG